MQLSISLSLAQRNRPVWFSSAYHAAHSFLMRKGSLTACSAASLPKLTLPTLSQWVDLLWCKSAYCKSSTTKVTRFALAWMRLGCNKPFADAQLLHSTQATHTDTAIDTPQPSLLTVHHSAA